MDVGTSDADTTDPADSVERELPGTIGVTGAAGCAWAAAIWQAASTVAVSAYR